jgi:predicted transposase YbfD/YdcC
MREAEVRKLIVEEFLGFIEDPRIERTRKHSLENILVISLLGVICGADSFVAIEEFGKAKKAWLTSFLDLETIPSHDTIGRVFAALDARALAEAFQRWTMAMAANSGEKLIAIDGKALRRSFRQAGDSAFVHMVSAWSVSNHVVLGQVKTDEKSNEITAIPQLLAMLDIKDALVTIDAAGAQTNIADTIIEKDGDYLLALKGNQPTLHDALIQHFTGHGSGHRDFDYFEVSERGHGREEIRRAWVSTAVGELDSALRWRSCDPRPHRGRANDESVDVPRRPLLHLLAGHVLGRGSARRGAKPLGYRKPAPLGPRRGFPRRRLPRQGRQRGGQLQRGPTTRARASQTAHGEESRDQEQAFGSRMGSELSATRDRPQCVREDAIALG